MSNMFFEYIYVSFKMVKSNMWAVTCDWLWVNWCHTCFLLINKSISHSETMMLWSDNITRASGEICLVNVRFAACPLSFDWKQKKNLLTFSATTNACLKKEEKKKKKSENEGGWILSVVFSFFFFFFGLLTIRSVKILLVMIQQNYDSCQSQFDSLFFTFLFVFFPIFKYIFYYTSHVTHVWLFLSGLWLRQVVSKWDRFMARSAHTILIIFNFTSDPVVNCSFIGTTIQNFFVPLE